MLGDLGWEHEGPSSRIGTVKEPYPKEPYPKEPYGTIQNPMEP